MEKKKLSAEQIAALRAPMPKEALSQHPTKTFLTTIKAIYVVERLNEVFGVGRWDFPTEIIENSTDYVTVKGRFLSEDYDVIVPSQFGGHKKTGLNTEPVDGYKSAVTDAMSKCASYLGVGIEVFKGLATQKGGAKSQEPVKPWYNTFEMDNAKMKEKIDSGEMTSQEIIDKIETKYKIAIKTKELILTLGSKQPERKATKNTASHLEN